MLEPDFGKRMPALKLRSPKAYRQVVQLCDWDASLHLRTTPLHQLNGVRCVNICIPEVAQLVLLAGAGQGTQMLFW